MAKRVLMCPPKYFGLEYSINPWMDLSNQVNREQARRQWDELVSVYRQLGFGIELMEPVEHLPDMVFTANGGLVINGRVMLARFKYPERQGESIYFKRWFNHHGFQRIYVPRHDFEGEGDCLFNGEVVFAGSGFRSSVYSHPEVERVFGKKVVRLRLADDRFYHLDTCFAPLDKKTIMFFPEAFDAPSRELIKENCERFIEADEDSAESFGLNAVSNGKQVVLSSAAKPLMRQLKDFGFEPIPVDLSEFKKSGGGAKCLTLELRS